MTNVHMGPDGKWHVYLVVVHSGEYPVELQLPDLTVQNAVLYTVSHEQHRHPE